MITINSISYGLVKIALLCVTEFSSNSAVTTVSALLTPYRE